MTRSARQSAPATARNRAPILDVLRGILPAQGLVLEISAGTGEHAAYFSRHFPELDWQPTDVEPTALASIEAWRDEGSPKVRAPLALDVTDDDWPVEAAAAVVSINLIHIAPWEACCGLMRGAARLLEGGGVLYLYGPYQIDGAHTAPSNVEFDAWLRGRDPSWGVRDLGAVTTEAEQAGLHFERSVAMPANNFSVIFRKPDD